MTTRRNRISTVEQLMQANLVPASSANHLEQVAAKYSVAISPAMQAAMLAEDGTSVSRQFVPTELELVHHPSELSDPIGDSSHSPVPGMTHRYPDRALLMPLLVCPVYCRFCFRREVVGQDTGLLSREALGRAFDYIRSQPGIWEVILTGGDPGILSPKRLNYILAELERIEHVQNLRIHTRVPVVAPEHVTKEFCDALVRNTPVWVVIHVNSAEELSGEAKEALAMMNRCGIPLLSQTVLLRGVNDTAEQLESLFRELVRNRVRPYYLHQLDLASGTGHFRVPIEEGQALMRQLRGNVSGLCLPQYMLDIPGGRGKVPIDVGMIERMQDAWIVESPLGGRHQYIEPSPW
ncbi:lysine-2,3-aminomutase-like protein [Kribbella sp. NPDC026611]|uniref:lysine-2,3-aminomutase-like protein n=1 Tax=Kribbella sp. NPDC026611 TaxID=3154911 RepID=UPI00340AC615